MKEKSETFWHYTEITLKTLLVENAPVFIEIDIVFPKIRHTFLRDCSLNYVKATLCISHFQIHYIEPDTYGAQHALDIECNISTA